MKLQAFLTSALYGGTGQPPVPSEYETEWTPQPVWTLWRRKNSCLCRESKPGRPGRSHPTLLKAEYKTSILNGFNTDIVKFRFVA